jgi:SAM-dependent methyltransferase
MTEKVGNVTIDYSFYKGSDAYSDGDIEDDLLKLVTEEPDVEKIIAKDNRWPVLYHFSPVRWNILEWYPFREHASVLEVGAGCGAISGVLCKNADKVVSVDLSKRRSLINANRNRDCGNLTIMVGNFNDVELTGKFDYITLIGVLEYAGYYTDAEEPFSAFLRKISGYLKEDGKLLIAIENKFGLKYWAGAREDHTGGFYDGLEGYAGTKSRVRTFSKEQLTGIIRDAGYTKTEFYYPFPDYKFPTQIFSDAYLPKEDDLNISLDVYDNTRIRLMDENRVYAQLLKEKKFDFFANSFFVEVAK